MEFSFFFLISLFFFLSCLARAPIPYGFKSSNGCAWQLDHSVYLPGNIVNVPSYLRPNYNVRDSLPANWDWRNVATESNMSLNFITPPRNQMLPRPCGSCWAISCTGALSDRLKIALYRNNKYIGVDVNLAPQYLLDCGEYDASDIFCGNCYGGGAYYGYQLIHETGISDETCLPYAASSPSHWGEQDDCADRMCWNCDRFGTCNYVAPQIRYYVNEYGVIKNTNLTNDLSMTETMMSEIYQRGPIVCSMYAHADSFENYTSGILTDNTTYPGTTHELVLLGWGTTSDGLDYWIGKNSFGTVWGENGFFYAQRGINIYNMEESCYWGTVKI